MLLQGEMLPPRGSGRAATRLRKALVDPNNRGAGTNRKLLGRLAPRSSTVNLTNHLLPHPPESAFSIAQPLASFP
jgi:hypothetical protein